VGAFFFSGIRFSAQILEIRMVINRQSILVFKVRFSFQLAHIISRACEYGNYLLEDYLDFCCQLLARSQSPFIRLKIA